MNIRIVSCNPTITRLLQQFGLSEAIVGISHLCSWHEGRGMPAAPVRVSEPGEPDDLLCPGRILWQVVRDCTPTHILGMSEREPEVVQALFPAFADQIRATHAIPAMVIRTFAPVTLDQLYECFEALGALVGARGQGVAYVHKLKAQFMNWGDNFYDRMKNKKVAFCSGIEPFRVAGKWIPDLIGLCSAKSLGTPGEFQDTEVSWEALLDFRPDVLIIAPRGISLEQSMRYFTTLEKHPLWEEILAVKRGAVFFTDGIEHFYDISRGLMDSMAILVSCIAGFDSGYITPRDSFFRLRWLELQRHRL